MVVTCQIHFDQNPHGTYFTGQVVTGKVTITADKPKDVRSVALKINGFAETRWTESESTTDSKGKSTSKTVTYSGREDYLASITYLLGSDESQSVTISPGIHTYNFATQLPIMCPSSYEGEHGHIRYLVKVVLIRPWKFDQTYSAGFTVLKLVDLNYESPLLRMPTNMEHFKEFCCWPCKSQPLHIYASVPQTGYVAGQIIPVTVSINNPTSVPVKEVKIGMYLVANFSSQYPRHETRTTRTCLVKAKTVSGLGKHFKNNISELVRVPAIPPSCQNLCSIIRIMYEIRVEAKVTGMHINPSIAIPITIGNVPLVNWASHSAQDPTSGQGMLQQIRTDTDSLPVTDPVINPTAPYSPDSDIPPPSYEESIFMARANISADDEHPLGKSEFAPRYPVFAMPDPTAPTEIQETQVGQTDSDEVDHVSQYTEPKKSTWL